MKGFWFPRLFTTFDFAWSNLQQIYGFYKENLCRIVSKIEFFFWSPTLSLYNPHSLCKSASTWGRLRNLLD